MNYNSTFIILMSMFIIPFGTVFVLSELFHSPYESSTALGTFFGGVYLGMHNNFKENI